MRAPDPPSPVAEFRPPVAPEPAALTEVKPAAAAGTTRESTSVAAIPATFLDPSQLTEKPRPLEEPRLDLLLPMLARAGVVQLILYVDESGNVERVEIDSATLPATVAERAAQIFAVVRFSPGRIEGTAVKTRVRITIGAEAGAPED